MGLSTMKIFFSMLICSTSLNKRNKLCSEKKSKQPRFSTRRYNIIGSTNSSQYGEQNMGTNGEGMLNLELKKLEKRRQQDAAAAMKFLERGQTIPSAIVNRIPKTVSRIKAVNRKLKITTQKIIIKSKLFITIIF